MNHFELLDLEQKYDIDLRLLQKQYLAKQALYHPDRVDNDELKSKNLDISMQLNEAYKILKDDYARAEYLLSLSGQKFDDQQLKEVLSRKALEALMESHEELDSMDKLSELQDLKVLKLKEKSDLVEELKECFVQKNMTKALEITIYLKYLTNLVKNIEFKVKHADN
ncbi:MAG: Fe-S protein assembly co-chaperone HscB [Rickettsiaceae bacterium]|nr:Fe-S protein assembly co-chaperone HscB [Rickettsiaceae bacterium]